MQYRREASGDASDVDMMGDDEVGALPAEFMDDGDDGSEQSNSDGGDGGDGDGGDDDGDNDDAGDDGAEDGDDGDDGDDDGEAEVKHSAGGSDDGGGDDDDDGDANDSGDAKQAPSDDDGSAPRSRAGGDDAQSTASASDAGSRKSKRSHRSRRDLRSAGGVSTVFSARAGEPDELPRPKSTVGQLSYPTVALTVKKRNTEQVNVELALVKAWAANRVDQILDATVQARFR